jgi:Ca-activated chloride channel family protein
MLMQFLNPLAFLGAAIAIPIILLYMLRLRRREVIISSTFLWQQILQDNEANTPLQKLRRNILLILQLIILALLVLSLARPFSVVPAVSAAQTALLIDASASMNATDQPNGVTRYEQAKQRALEVIDTMSADSILTVINVSENVEVRMPYTSDRQQLRSTIETAQPSMGEGDWLTALTLAAEGGRSAQDFRIVIIGDGGIGDANNLPDISLPGDVSFINVGQSDQNVAISALASREVPGGTPQLFAQLTNYGSADAEVIFTLRTDGETVPLTSARYTIPANGSLPITSTEAFSQSFTQLEAELTSSVNSPSADYLTLDNRAYAVASTASTRRILLVTENNVFIEQVLRSQPGIEFFKALPGRSLPAQPYDLYIFDNNIPTTLPNGDMLFINPDQNTSLFTVGAQVEQIDDISLESADERLAFVDFGSVNILKYRQVQSESWGETLIRAGDDPLFIAGDSGGRQVGIFTFDLRDSDLPLQITFPVLISNLLEWYAPSGAIASGTTFTIGDTVPIRPPFEAESLRITSPDGTSQDLLVDRDSLAYTQTDQPGIYTLEVLEGSEVTQTQYFAVNAFAPGESDIAPQQITIGGVTADGQVTEELGQQEYWSLIALLALLFLLIEWYVYHRQLRIPTIAAAVRPRYNPPGRAASAS